MCDTKKCSKCGEVKGFDAFPKHKGRKDGLDNRCKHCALVASHAYRQANIEVVREKDRIRAAALTDEARRAKHQKWRDANREYVRSQGRKVMQSLYQKDADKFRKRSKAYWQENSEVCIEKGKAYRRELRAGYVAMTLDMKVSEVPPELIALKREQLAIKRMARELKKAATQQDGATP